jgi:hypothetical protein
MTLIESELFRKIQPHEWLNQSWTRPDKKKRAPGIMNMIQRFNDVRRRLAPPPSSKALPLLGRLLTSVPSRTTTDFRLAGHRNRERIHSRASRRTCK